MKEFDYEKRIADLEQSNGSLKHKLHLVKEKLQEYHINFGEIPGLLLDPNASTLSAGSPLQHRAMPNQLLSSQKLDLLKQDFKRDLHAKEQALLEEKSKLRQA